MVPHGGAPLPTERSSGSISAGAPAAARGRRAGEPSASISRRAPPSNARGAAARPGRASGRCRADVAAAASRPCRRCRAVRVAAAQRPRACTGTRRPSISPSAGPSDSCTSQRPDPARSWAAGGWPAERTSKSPVAQVEREVDRGREPLVPVLAEQVVVGRGQELVRRQRRQQAAERAGEQQRAGAGLLPLAGDVDDASSSRRPIGPGRRRRSRPRTACHPRSAAPTRRTSRAAARGAALAQDPVAQVDQHRLAMAPADPEPGAAERRQQHDEADHEDHRDTDDGARA